MADTILTITKSSFESTDPENYDVSRLQPVLEALKTAQKPEELVEASSEIWLASRNEDWRLPIGESGILTFFHDLLVDETFSKHAPLKLNALKILGNSCADRDANRQRLVDHPAGIAPFVKALEDKDTRFIAAIVLSNIITDFDPSQKVAISSSAIPTVFAAIAKTDELSGPLHPYLRVLEILLAHESGPSTAPESAFETLLNILLSPTADNESVDFDNALSIISIIHTLAPLPRFTTLLSTDSKLFPRLLDALEWTIENVHPEETDNDEKKRKDAGLVAHAKNQLVESIGEAAAADNFLTTFPFASPVMQRVKDMLQVQDKKEERAIAACMILGNVGRSDSVCSVMLSEHSLHIPVMSVISTTLESYSRSVAAIRSQVSSKYGDPASIAGTGAMSISTLHAGLGVLKNLALPQVNKPKLGDDGVFPLLRKLLELDGVASGQIYYSTISLIRILINLCPENVERLFVGEPVILLEKILERGMKSDAEAPLKVEAMRTTVGIIRTGYKFAREDLVQKMIDTQGEERIADVLWGMVAQNQYATVRSEGLFALALMGSENEGQGVVKVGWKKIWGAEAPAKKEENTPGQVLGEVVEGVEEKEEEKKKEVKKGKTGEELLMDGLAWGAKDSDNIMAVAATMGKEGENVLRAALGGRVEVMRSLENEVWST